MSRRCTDRPRSRVGQGLEPTPPDPANLFGGDEHCRKVFDGLFRSGQYDYRYQKRYQPSVARAPIDYALIENSTPRGAAERMLRYGLRVGETCPSAVAFFLT